LTPQQRKRIGGLWSTIFFRYIVFGKRFRIRNPHHLPFHAPPTHDKRPFRRQTAVTGEAVYEQTNCRYCYL